MRSGKVAPRKKRKRKVSKKEKDGNAEVVFYFWRFSVLFREDGIFLEDMTLWDANKGWVWMNEKLKCILLKCTMVPPRPSLANTKCRMNYVTRYYGPFTVVAVVAVAFNIIIWNIIYRVASECLSKITVSRWQCSMCISRRARLSIWMVRRPICRLRDCVPLLSISFVSVDSCVCFFGSLLFHIFNCTLHFVCHRKITFCSESLNHRSFLLIIYSIEWYAVPATRIAHEMVCKCVSCVCVWHKTEGKKKRIAYFDFIFMFSSVTNGCHAHVCTLWQMHVETTENSLDSHWLCQLLCSFRPSASVDGRVCLEFGQWLKCRISCTSSSHECRVDSQRMHKRRE